MAGRAAAVLMLADQPMTLAELQEALGASKGSVSESTRLLIVNGAVVRDKPAGSRQFVFRWRDDAWVGCLRHQLDQTVQLLALAETGCERAAGLSETQQRRLRQMRDYYRYMVGELEVLLADYAELAEGPARS